MSGVEDLRAENERLRRSNERLTRERDEWCRIARRGPDARYAEDPQAGRYSITVAHHIDLPGVVDSAAAWARARVIEREVANVMAAHGVASGGSAPLVNVYLRDDEEGR